MKNWLNNYPIALIKKIAASKRMAIIVAHLASKLEGTKQDFNMLHCSSKDFAQKLSGDLTVILYVDNFYHM